MTLEVPDFVRATALGQGDVGRAWLDGLDASVADLAGEWGLGLGRVLEGGTASLVVEATTRDGREAILKLAVPGLDPGRSEMRVLVAADGRGFARVYRHDHAREALLLERLGPKLITLGLPVETQIGIICGLLRQTWSIAPPPGLMNGAEKAAWHIEFMSREWRSLGRPCSQRAVDLALRFAEARGRAYDPARAVLAHGDGHAWNTLLASDEGERRFKFVDPDGLFIEPAYDLAIPMREWSGELLAGDPVDLGRRRCRLLAELTGVEPEPIWQWGLVERVSSALLWVRDGRPDVAQEFFDVAEAWAAAEV
jgi:streptomycin 6-kinase